LHRDLPAASGGLTRSPFPAPLIFHDTMNVRVYLSRANGLRPSSGGRGAERLSSEEGVDGLSGCGRLGECVFCGRDAGVLRKEHPKCREAHDTGFPKMISLTKNVAVTSEGIDGIEDKLANIARSSYLSP